MIHKGDALNYIYYIFNGSMEVMQDNMVVAILGEFIADESFDFLMNIPHVQCSTNICIFGELILLFIMMKQIM